MSSSETVVTAVANNENEKQQKVNKKASKKQAAVSNEPARQRPAGFPQWILDRVSKWDSIASKPKTETHESKRIEITLPDGKVLEGESYVTSPMEIARKISVALSQRVIIAKIDGEKLWDLNRPLENSCKLELLDFNSPEAARVFWHSSAHILGQAIEREFHDAKLCIGPPLEEGGFYYDVYLGDEKVTPEDYKYIEETVKEVTKSKQPFERLELKKEEALDMFKDNQFKVSIIRNKVPDGATCTAYRCGPLIDLCKGPHIPNTSLVSAMSVTKHGAAYWLGKAENESLQRIYGISFPDKKSLKEWQLRMKLAEEQDHRKIGIQQKLFFFHDWSPGSPFFLPHGARLYNTLMNFIRNQYWQRGYTEVISPNVYNVELWKVSGHYEHYKENMFMFEVENQEFAMKPMNCPGHCLMFRHDLKSYRDLPIRMADFGVLHRNEISGALTGLTRVRRFQQDDSHIFARHDQIEQEVGGVLDMLQTVYSIFGFTFELKLSTRPEKFAGTIETWDRAEKQLQACLDSFCSKIGSKWELNPGDGAFYGPKIDIQLKDALHRKHQCATVQLDFVLPSAEKFNLQYKSENGEFAHPVMIHRAILGSVERMIAVLIEHTGGKWPFWLSPRQCIVVPVSEKQFEYAEQVRKVVHEAGFFVDVDTSNRQLPKKVFEAQAEGYNLFLVVGEKEVEANQVNIRFRDNVDPLSPPVEAASKKEEETDENKAEGEKKWAKAVFALKDLNQLVPYLNLLRDSHK